MKERYKLIRSRLLLPLSGEKGSADVIEDGYLLTEGRLIREVGRYTPETGRRIIRETGGELQVIGKNGGDDLIPFEIPCLDGVVLPGFVRVHGHDYQSPIIGICRDEPLSDWLDRSIYAFIRFLSERHDELEAELGESPHLLTYRKSLLDNVYYGITSALSHHGGANKYHVPELVEANEEAGLKLTIAVSSADRSCDPRVVDTPETAIRRLDEYTARFKERENIRIIPGPNQVFSNSHKLLRALKTWAREHGTLIHIHSSEEPGTTAWFYRQYLCSPVEYLHQVDFLDPETILAHQVNNTPVDLEILEKTGVGIAHNPLCNAIMGSGMPPLIEMLKRGIPVAVATDGSGSADNQNMLAAARLASQYQKAYHRDARLLPARQVLEMITRIPARMMRLNTGSLEPGKDADFILVDLSRPNLTPTRPDNVIENLIWASDGSEIRWVIAGGKILKDDYRLTGFAEKEIKSGVQLLSERLMEWKKEQTEMKVTGARKEG